MYTYIYLNKERERESYQEKNMQIDLHNKYKTKISELREENIRRGEKKKQWSLKYACASVRARSPAPPHKKEKKKKREIMAYTREMLKMQARKKKKKKFYFIYFLNKKKRVKCFFKKKSTKVSGYCYQIFFFSFSFREYNQLFFLHSL